MSVPKEYVEAVTKLAKDKTNRRFLNDSGEHAELLIRLMIGQSQPDEQVSIYSGELKLCCYGEALKTAKGDIRILVDDAEGLNVVKSLPQDVQSRIKIKLATDKHDSHFYVSGNAMRYELSHADATAVANFNEPESKLQVLKDRFDNMWERAVSA